MSKEVNYTEKEDFLDEDKEIPGQKFCLLSFLSPEKVLTSKDASFFSSFVKDYEIQYKTKKLEAFLAETVRTVNSKLEAEAVKAEKLDLSGIAVICRTSQVKMETVLADLEGYVRKNQAEIKETTIQEAYEDFLYKNGTRLEEEFYAKNNFRTSVRGLKIRGVYASQGEAVARSKQLQRNDTIHNVFVGEVGKWLPWDPNPNAVAEQEYAEDQLNTLMKKYKENETARDTFYSEQRQKGVKGMAGQQLKVERPEPEAADASAFTAGVGSYASMFSGPADLVMERRKEKRDEDKKD
jgi:thymidylate synthase